MTGYRMLEHVVIERSLEIVAHVQVNRIRAFSQLQQFANLCHHPGITANALFARLA